MTVELDHWSLLVVECAASSEQKVLGELRKRGTEGETILKQQTEEDMPREISTVPHDIQVMTEFIDQQSRLPEIPLLSVALWRRYRVRKEGVRWNDEAGLKDYLFKRHSKSASFTWRWEQVQVRERKILRQNATAGGGSDAVSSPERGCGRVVAAGTCLQSYATAAKEMTVREGLNTALDEEMPADPEVSLCNLW
ncbi:uncharacterized protein LOC130135121 [Syzygium oleosum]|uniref:uncharacterized protein LOC130135121 n=1 Tax=Syzygium oleosum TaxID=219896 RepID=UPI0024B8F766|nr:uncharacterized protein LOC130135121 [Syzygium oleosum]